MCCLSNFRKTFFVVAFVWFVLPSAVYAADGDINEPPDANLPN